MFFGSLVGLNTFFPDQIRDNPNPPAVVITALNLRDQVLRTDLPADEKSSCPIKRTIFPLISSPWTTPLLPKTSTLTNGRAGC